MAPPLLLGHRGARRSAPENTFAAFDLALAQGCDGFEFDVRSTADGRSVICHDPRVRGLEVACSSWQALRAAGSVSGRAASLACLEEVMARYAASAFLDIELKVSGLESAVCAALEAYPPRRGYVVSSFLPEALEAVRQHDPRVPLGWICEDARQLSNWRQLGVEILAPHYKLATPKLIAEARAAGKQIFVWTVNRKPEILRFAELGVDAIISDDTRLLGRLRDDVHHRDTETRRNSGS